MVERVTWSDFFPSLPSLDAYLRYEVRVHDAFVILDTLPDPANPLRDAQDWVPSPDGGAREAVLSHFANAWAGPSGDGGAPVGFLPSRALGITTVSTESLAAMLYLTWPRFEKALGCTLLADFSSRNLPDWIDRFEGDLGRAEEMVNHLHLWDWFSEEPSAPEFEMLAERLAVQWRRKLAYDFPAEAFIVHTEVGAYGPEITMRTVRETTAAS